jgi:asparagine synthase (glutamine-hydrolysing)
MTATLVHRGPDAADHWVDERAGVALGFQRLAIVDLTPTGMQPMTSHSGRYTVVFNGEIYNHRALRAELPGVAWRGSSDTEAMLAAFDRWGVAGALPRLEGMFALAVWDDQERTLTLARDRMGEKPLYYGLHGGVLLFGSELKALRAHPSFHTEIDRDALARYLYASFVPGPQSIHKGTWKLPPGTSLTIAAAHLGSGTLPEPVAYWRLRDHVARASSMDDREVVDRLAALLHDAVGRQMVADVPLGAFLSGGIDSSAIVALMQAQSSRPVQTFTVAIPDTAALDESAHAAKVAHHLGTEHHSLAVTATDARAVIPRLGSMYDEPFADSSQIPTHLVSELARRHVTVALSGDGGDEVFGGYRRYLLAPKVAERTRRLPGPAARAGRAAITGVPVRMWDRVRPGLGYSAHRLASVLDNRGVDDVYERVFGSIDGLGLVSGHRVSAGSVFADLEVPPGSATDRMMYRDSLTYLPDDICAKVDRAAMAVSLETRMPYLDHRVVEFAWSLPTTAHLRDGTTKWALREVLARHVPTALTDRPKAGFGIPIGAWLRGPLRSWADDLLAPAGIVADGYLDAAAVGRLWAAHREGRRDHTLVLWNVLMFQSWLHAQA